MDSAEYWIGKSIDYDSLWSAYADGEPYMGKFRAMETHMLRIHLHNFDEEAPLFNFEAVYKTIKGYFHDLKRACLTTVEYNQAGPLFIYGVDRGSGIWTFLGELRQLLLLGTTLADEKVMGQRLKNLDKKLEILRKHFRGAVTPEIFEAFAKANTPRQLDRAVRQLLDQGIEKIEISARSFRGKVKEIEPSFVDVKRIMKDGDRPE